jgi:hypothetical protein
MAKRQCKNEALLNENERLLCKNEPLLSKKVQEKHGFLQFFTLKMMVVGQFEKWVKIKGGAPSYPPLFAVGGRLGTSTPFNAIVVLGPTNGSNRWLF